MYNESYKRVDQKRQMTNEQGVLTEVQCGVFGPEVGTKVHVLDLVDDSRSVGIVTRIIIVVVRSPEQALKWARGMPLSLSE